MEIHLGKEIESTAKGKGLSQGKVAELIGDIQQNVGNDYKREHLPIDKILKYSEALNKNFVAFYYDEEPLKSYREQEFAEWQAKINELQEKLNQAEKLLASKDEAVAAMTETVTTQKELIETQRKLIEERTRD